MVADQALSRPVPVVRLIVQNAGGKVLILKRAQSAYADGAWCLPGGKVDYGETVEQAAAKELREETSLTCETLRFLFYQDNLPARPGAMHCINLYVECRVAGHVVTNPESTAASWIGPEDVDTYEIAFGNDEALRRYWHGTA